MMKKMLGVAAGLLVVLILFWPEVKNHLVVYEGPCIYDAGGVGIIFSGGRLPMSCGNRSVVAYAPPTEISDEVGEWEAPCKVYADNHVDCNFQASRLIGSGKAHF
jgi:hypothetical protein